MHANEIAFGIEFETTLPATPPPLEFRGNSRAPGGRLAAARC